MITSRTISPALISLCVGVFASTAFAQTVRTDSAPAGRVFLEASVAEYQKQTPTARIELGLAGSAGSLSKLCSSDSDLAIATRPIQKSEISLCADKKVEFVEVPVALDAVVLVVNRLNGFATNLSVEELKTIWARAAQGKIIRWNQVRSEFPDRPLKLLGPDPSFEGGNAFTEAILGSGQAARRDYMVSVDDNVLIQGVARDPNTLGYVSLASYSANRHALRAVPIVAKAGGSATEPSLENVSKGVYQPLTRPLFLYVSAKALERPPVREFAEFLIASGDRNALAAGLAPVSESTYKLGLAHLRDRKTGTAWNGSIPVAPTREEMQKRLAGV